jgi:tight adherence protein B
MIIGVLPPGVMAMVYFTTPNYIMPLFTTRVGNLMLAGCAIWMSMGVFIMKKMISFKH